MARVQRRLAALAMAAALVLVPAGGAAAEEAPEPTPEPTEVTALSAERTDGSLRVSGAAAFGGQAPVVVGEDPTGDAPFHPELARLGLDATSIAVHQPDPDTAEIVFVINVTALETPPPPEVVRYLWQFRVAGAEGQAGEEFWVQAKTSDVASGTTFLDDPAGAVQHVPGSFRLRGNCQEVQLVATCQHLAWLDGVFDVEQDQVRVTVPLGLEVAPEFTPGAVIRTDDGMTASIQAGASNSATSDTVIQGLDYPIPGERVLLGVAPAGTDPAQVAFATPATLAEDGSFSADLDISELTAGSYEVFAQACFADNCGVRSAPFTVP